MKIDHTKKFKKMFKKLPKNLKRKVIETIEVFIEYPFDPRLRDHALKGYLKGTRSISVNSDLRIIFKESDGYTLVLMLDLGTHNQVY